jgi:hypothetical protein
MSERISRDEWIDFLRMLRRVFVELTRWIERRYPETISQERKR